VELNPHVLDAVLMKPTWEEIPEVMDKDYKL